MGGERAYEELLISFHSEEAHRPTWPYGSGKLLALTNMFLSNAFP